MANIFQKLIAVFNADTKGYEKGVKSMDSANKKTEQSTEGLSSAVDTLNEELTTAIQNTGILPGKLNNVVGGLGKLTQGFKGLKLAIAATGIGALLLALGSLAAFFTKSAEGQEKFLKITKTAGAILSKVTDLFVGLGGGIADSVSSTDKLKETFNGFLDFLKGQVITRLDAVKKFFVGVFETISFAAQGEFSKAGEAALKAGEAVIEFNTGFTVDQIKSGIQSVAGFFEDVAENAQKALDIADRQNALSRREIEFIERRAFLEKQIEELKLAAADTSLTELQRLEAIQKATQLQNELSNTNVKIAKERAAILEAEQALGSNTIEDNKELAELKAEILKADQERATKLKELVTQENTLLAVVQKFRDQLRDAIENPATDQPIDLSGVEVILPEGFDNRTIQERIEEDTQLQIQALDEVNAKAAESAELQGEYSDFVAQKKKTEAQQNVDAAAAIFNITGSLLKEGTAAQKAVGVAEALINTYKAANLALASAPPPASYALAAASVVAGLVNVQKILSTKAPETKTVAAPKFAEGGQVPVNGGMITGQDHSLGGVKFAAGGITNEAQGGEFIVNRKATRAFLPLLQKINNTGRSRAASRSNYFAEGGQISTAQALAAGNRLERSLSEFQAVLVVEDFNRVQNRVNVAENLSTF